ncbi:MAG: hypothetical protein AABZ60_00470, partial [Planctomycetota bacterium]
IDDLFAPKSYLLSLQATQLKFFQIPASAIQKEPLGNIFRMIDIFAENKEGEWKGEVGFGKEYSSYHYNIPIQLQGEIRKKYSILIEEDKRQNNYYTNDYYQLTLSQKNQIAPLPIKKSSNQYKNEGTVLIISKDPIFFGSTHPFYVISPKEIEPYLVRLLEMDLIVIYDRSFPFISESQWQLLTDYVRYGGKLLFYQEKENDCPLLKELHDKTWKKCDLIPNEISYLYTNYYQGIVVNLTHPKIYEMEFREKLKATIYGNIDIPDKRLFDDLLCFPTLPPVLGTYVFRSSSLKDKYFSSTWLGFLFFFSVFLGCGPGFLLLFRKHRGKKVLLYQLVLLLFFSGIAIGFSTFLTSQIGNIDTLSFYYLDEHHEGYVIDYHMMGGSGTHISDLEISNPSPFYVLSPLGKKLPDFSSYYSSEGAIAVQTAYTSKWQDTKVVQSLWNATPIMTTKPISLSGGFYVEKNASTSVSTLVNETPFDFSDVWLVEIENTLRQPYINSQRFDYNRSYATSIQVNECFLPSLASNKYPYSKDSKHFNITSVTFTPSNNNFRLFEKVSYRYNVNWEPRFDQYSYLFTGVPNGLYVLATKQVDRESEFQFEMPITSSKLKQTSRTVVWLQRIADKFPP